jgi:hypothetical protein
LEKAIAEQKAIHDAIQCISRKTKSAAWDQGWIDGCKAEAKKRNISLTTLRRRAKSFLKRGTTDKAAPGVKSTLTAFEESKVKEWIDMKTRTIETPTTHEIQNFARNILECRGVNGRLLSDAWVTRFCQRNKVRCRQARSLAQDRSNVKPMQVAAVFDRVEQAEEKEKARYIIGWDETGWHGFFDSLKGITVRCSEELREEAYRMTPTERQHVTCVLCTILDTLTKKSWALPDLWVFPAANLNTTHTKSQLEPSNWRRPSNITVEGSARVVREVAARFPPGYEVAFPLPDFYKAASPSGNVTSDIVFNYWTNAILPALRQHDIPDSAVKNTFGDNHSTHITEALLTLQEDAGHRLFFFAPHSTHICQFLDLVQMGILKREGRKCITAWSAFLQKYAFRCARSRHCTSHLCFYSCRRRGLKLHVEDFPVVVANARAKAVEEKQLLRCKARSLPPYLLTRAHAQNVNASTPRSIRTRWGLPVEPGQGARQDAAPGRGDARHLRRGPSGAAPARTQGRGGGGQGSRGR